MNVHAETQIKIEFANGMEITPIIVFNQVEITSRQETFHKSTHQIEELINHITEWENSGCDVFF